MTQKQQPEFQAELNGVRIMRTVRPDGIAVYHRDDYKLLENTNAEKGEHKTCCSWLEYHFPALADLTWHTANERMGNARHGAELKQMGVKSGVSDFITLCTGAAHPAGAFELKREQYKGSRMSKEQREFLLSAMDSGKFACCCHGADAFKVAVCEYLGVDLVP